MKKKPPHGVVLTVKPAPGPGEPSVPGKVIQCRSLVELARWVGEYRAGGGQVLQFDDPLHYQVGFCPEDQTVHWLLPVGRFFKHFDSEKVARRAFNRRREFVFELGDGLIRS